MRKSFRIGLLAAIATTFLFFACKKEKELDTDVSTAEDQSQGELNYDLVFKQVDMAATDNGLKKGGYPVITVDSSVSPRTMSIYYGETNYLCQDGNYRRGTILVSWTGRYKEVGTVINIGFDKFFQNDNMVEGTKTIANSGRNSEGKLVFNIQVSGKITSSSGLSHTWNSTRTRTWISGELTRVVMDDIYEVSGSSSGVNRNGISYSALITQNLRIDLGCDWRITSGIVEITPEGKALRTINFGNGACDNQFTVTVNGKTKTVIRRK